MPEYLTKERVQRLMVDELRRWGRMIESETNRMFALGAMGALSKLIFDLEQEPEPQAETHPERWGLWGHWPRERDMSWWQNDNGSIKLFRSEQSAEEYSGGKDWKPYRIPDDHGPPLELRNPQKAEPESQNVSWGIWQTHHDDWIRDSHGKALLWTSERAAADAAGPHEVAKPFVAE